MLANLSQMTDSRRRSLCRVQFVAFVITSLVIIFYEVPIWLDPASRSRRLSGLLAGAEPDWLPFAAFIILFPLCWFGGRRNSKLSGHDHQHRWWDESPVTAHTSLALAWCLAVLVSVVAFAMSFRIGQQFDSLPPAYHDEYSYLLQAQTFLDGRWSSPSFEAAPEIFNQMHVLNEGKVASRYFPGTGIWIAPFLKFGHPWLGHQLAHALAAMLVFWTGRELANSGTGLLAGVLFALSPGLLLFSNLLLAHHPTLVGLMIFLWAFCRFMRTQQSSMALLAGSGLAFAMLCRPMTAAGFGLPFGAAFCWWWMNGFWSMRTTDVPDCRSTLNERSRAVIAMAIPLAAGFAIVILQNIQITGNPVTSPYQLYTETYTPRHVYGFNNVTRGEQNLGPKVIDNYDRWAENLTPELAARNVGTRIISSCRLTMGIVPILAATILGLFTMRLGDPRWWLIFCSIVSLHVVHVPYWFVGIMGWHYVLETAPMWVLLFAEVTRRMFSFWRVRSQTSMMVCWFLLVIVSVAVNLVTVRPVWPAALDQRIPELKFPRELYQQFRQGIEDLRDGEPAIVFVIPDPADRSMDYVSNPHNLQGPVLVARLTEIERLADLRKLFPDRRLLLFDARNRRFRTVTGERK